MFSRENTNGAVQLVATTPIRRHNEHDEDAVVYLAVDSVDLSVLVL